MNMDFVVFAKATQKGNKGASNKGAKRATKAKRGGGGRSGGGGG